MKIFFISALLACGIAVAATDSTLKKSQQKEMDAILDRAKWISCDYPPCDPGNDDTIPDSCKPTGTVMLTKSLSTVDLQRCADRICAPDAKMPLTSCTIRRERMSRYLAFAEWSKRNGSTFGTLSVKDFPTFKIVWDAYRNYSKGTVGNTPLSFQGYQQFVDFVKLQLATKNPDTSDDAFKYQYLRPYVEDVTLKRVDTVKPVSGQMKTNPGAPDSNKVNPL